MVPIRCGEGRNGIGSVLSGRIVFMKIPGKEPPLRPGACSWSRPGSGKFNESGKVQSLAGLKPGKIKGMPAETKPPRCPDEGQAAAIEVGEDLRQSAVAKAFGGAFPLRHVIGDHAGRFHRGLAQLGIAGDFALHPLTFGMQQVAQAFEFGNQVLDFRERGAGDALDQRVDVVDGGFVLGSSAVSALLSRPGAGRRR